jgi:hypothetical protein
MVQRWNERKSKCVIMVTYSISFAASIDHVPDHPERTAFRAQASSLNFDYTYRVWPSRAAMRKTIMHPERT